MNKKNNILLSFAILIGLPTVVYANAGTSLMWATLFHLVVGNAIIGIIEGYFIAKVFRLEINKSIVILIFANYFSAWIGRLFFGLWIADYLYLDLNNIRMWLAVLVLLAYVFTLIIEWPFIALYFRGTSGWMRNSIWATILVQTLSYLLLIGWYWMSSGTSLLFNMNIVQPSDMHLPGAVLVYYISPKDGNVYLRHLSKDDDQKIFTLKSKNKNDRLFAMFSENNSQQSDIVARLETREHRKPSFIVVESSLQGLAVKVKDVSFTRGTRFNFGTIPRLDPSESNSWEVSTGFWPVEGMNGTNKKTGKTFRFSLETPFAAWIVRNAVLLPDNKVLFQLGDDQICLLDIETNRIALITKGRGPLPVMEGEYKKIEQGQSTRSLRSG